jgi:NAD(P)-dependent dehydrogenase (short-subunit alcohol dehydrogenase family)
LTVTRTYAELVRIAHLRSDSGKERVMTLAVVTGSSSGIGLATAVALARAGHSVAATMRNLDGGADLRQIIAREKLPITLTALDVDDDDSVRDAFVKVVAENGPIDVLVNNAGVPGAAGGVEEIPFNVFQQMMETNFFGALRCIKAVVSGMRERRSGTIVNVTSLAGRIARASLAPYAASKWALEALSECLAQEMRAFNVRVAIDEPGVIATPILTKGYPIPAGGPYPHSRRLTALFAARLANPTPPSLVGDLIRDIVDGDSWQLRYPAGPDAAPVLKARASKTDEQVISEAAESDDEFIARVKREFGLDLTL